MTRKRGLVFAWKRRFWKNRGLGFTPNVRDDRDRLYVQDGELFSYNEMNASLEKYSTVVDQDGTSSCVGNAVAGAIWIMEQKSSHKYGYPSRLFLYWNSRNQHSNVPFKDDGTYIRTCCNALKKMGVPDENEWAFKRSKVNFQPSYKGWGKADPRKGGEYLSIKNTGRGRVEAICQAISDGYPVVFGTSVSESFMPAIGPEIIDCPLGGDKLVGGHAMVIVGYKRTGGGYLFRVLNSWGKYWRDGGLCWFTEDYIMWEKSSDFTIIRGWRRIAS